MRVIKIGGLCLCATAALACAIGAASAAALPAFFECHKGVTGSGMYANSKCTEEAKTGKGKYEIQEGIGKGKAFKGGAGRLTYHIPANGFELTCSSANDEGTINSPTTMDELTLTLRGCEVLKKRCTSEGAPFGTIVTSNLAGTLGYINKAKKEVGVSLKAESGTLFAAFNCEGIEFEVTGSLIGSIEPVNVFTKTEHKVFRVNGEGFQQLRQFEGGPTEVLFTLVNGSGPFETGIQMEFSSKGEELEIEA